MITCDSESYQSSAKLAQTFQASKKEDLKEIAKILGISVPSNLKKDEYTKQLADKILSNPEQWLGHLPHYELTLLQKLVAAGPNQYVEEPLSLCYNTLQITGLVAFDLRGNQSTFIRYMICDELRESIAPHMEHCLSEEQNANRFLIEQVAIGLTNLYGFVSHKDMLEKLRQYMPESIQDEEIEDFIQHSILMRQNTVYDAVATTKALGISSSFLDDLDSFSKKIQMYKAITSPKQFTLEELKAAGSQPIPQVIAPITAQLKEVITGQLGYSEVEANYHLQQLWINVQLEGQPMPVIAPIVNNKLSSMEDLQKVVAVFMEYHNNCPRWFMKGYSSSEIHQLFPQPAPKKAPVRSNKVGRNDACPCGSGKKYKHCCGKN